MIAIFDLGSLVWDFCFGISGVGHMGSILHSGFWILDSGFWEGAEGVRPLLRRRPKAASIFVDEQDEMAAPMAMQLDQEPKRAATLQPVKII